MSELSPKSFHSIKQCVAATGIPHGVLKKAKAANCPAFDDHGRIDFAELLKWLFRVDGEPDSTLPDGFGTWIDYLNSIRADREKIRRDRERGKTMDTDEAKSQAQTAEAYYFGELDRMLREMPAALHGLSAIEIETKLSRFIANLKEQSRKQFNAITGTTDTDIIQGRAA